MKKRLVVLLVSVFAAISLYGCGGGESQYDRDFKSGMEKYNNGQKMTKGEANAVKNFKDWQNNQGEKTYDQWN